VSFPKRRPYPGSVDLGRMLLQDLRSLRNEIKTLTLPVSVVPGIRYLSVKDPDEFR